MARSAFAENGASTSMAEIARRATVGMATLYRNFSGKRELLEALYVDEVDAICDAAVAGAGQTSTEALETWLECFVSFAYSKRPLFLLLMVDSDLSNPVFDSSRDRVLAAGRPLFEAAQADGAFHAALTLQQMLDLLVAIATISNDPEYLEPIWRAALRGFRKTD